MFPWIVLNAWVHFIPKDEGTRGRGNSSYSGPDDPARGRGERERGTSSCSGPRTKGFHEELTLSNPGP